MRTASLFLMFLMAPAAFAGGGIFDGAAIVVLGEQHDNPHHHARQAEIVGDIRPAAIVFEMLDAGQASQVTPALRDDPVALEAALGWNDSGWPDFELYYPIFAAAPEAEIFGAAVPRDAARAAMTDGIAESFAGDAATYGLDQPLPVDQQAARETLQHEAHCGALPAELLPGMVDVQRLRDAELARVALAALDQTGGPVAVITGNGHARRDWGMPFYVERVRPGLKVVALGQAETGGGAPPGTFDVVEETAPTPREDPCAAFR